MGNSAIQIRALAPVPANGYVEVSPDGTQIEAQVRNVNELRQVWMVQLMEGFEWALVNAASGQCILAPEVSGVNGTYSTAPCGPGDRFITMWQDARA